MRRNRKNTIKFLYAYEKAELFGRIKDDNSKFGVRNRAIFLLAKYCALRISEIGLMQMQDYNPLNQTVFCRRLKNGNSNTLKIVNTEVLQAIDLYYNGRAQMDTDSQYLFLSRLNRPISRKTLDNIMKNYCVNSCIPKDKQHFHVLRHTRAIELIEYQFDVRSVQWWLGHVNINNTMIYLNYTPAAQAALFAELEYLERQGT